MSKATKTDTQSSAPHAADSHDLIRVQGARVNNLKDVSVEIPKRRLTLFTGVSGSGKSSLVFGTIAAESQRMINETYSAFVQGFMPTPAPPSGPSPTPTPCCGSSSAGSASRRSDLLKHSPSTSPRSAELAR